MIEPPLDYLFVKTIDSFKTEVRDLYDKRALMPCLMLLYSFIDILSWLRYEKKYKKVWERYIKFTESYLLPYSRLECAAEDIYSARCGILHQYSSESDQVKAGSAKKIHYIAHEEEKRTIMPDDPNTIIIHIEDLIHAFEKSIEKLKKDLTTNVMLEIEVVERSRSWLIQSDG
jgi:hypothetical protein